MILSSLHIPFGANAAAVINVFILIIAILITANVPLKWPQKEEDTEEDSYEDESEPTVIVGGATPLTSSDEGKNGKEKNAEPAKKEDNITVVESSMKTSSAGKTKAPSFANYVPPPLSLLNSDTSKPTTGDLLANAISSSGRSKVSVSPLRWARSMLARPSHATR